MKKTLHVQFVEIILQVHHDSAAKSMNTFKKKVRKYIHGSLELLLLWCHEVQEVLERKPLK